jgi:hypothetical protein
VKGGTQMKKFLITENEKLADIAQAKDHKEAVVNHAIANRLNPIDVEAEEVGDVTIKELFVKGEVKKRLNKNYPFHTEEHATGITEQVLEDEEMWFIIEGEIDGQIIYYMNPQE